VSSTRRRLTVGLLAGLVLVVGACGLLLSYAIGRALVAQFDATLRAEAELFTAASELERGRLDFDFSELPLAEFEPSDRAQYYQVLDSSGRSLLRSASLGQGDLAHPPAGPGGARIADRPLPDGRAGRILVQSFVPHRSGHHPQPAAPALTLVMARSRAGLDHALAELRLLIAACGLVLLLGTLAVVLWAVRRGLAPLGRLAAEVAGIEVSGLDHRFAAADLPAELAPIAARLDEMLVRLSAAFERERRFSADVAHELRTPIAELRSLAEVSLQDERVLAEAELRLGFEDALAIALQMERRVEALLALARCEAGLQPLERGSVEVVSLIQRAWEPFAARARARRLTVQQSLPAEAWLESDPALLSAVLDNLFANALAYTSEGGLLDLAFETRPDGWSLKLANDDGSLGPEDLPHLFEPFWRKDPARSDSARAGLGLSLVAAYTHLLGIRITADLPIAGRFELTLSGSNP